MRVSCVWLLLVLPALAGVAKEQKTRKEPQIIRMFGLSVEQASKCEEILAAVAAGRDASEGPAQPSEKKSEIVSEVIDAPHYQRPPSPEPQRQLEEHNKGSNQHVIQDSRDFIEVHAWRHDDTKDEVEVHTWRHGGMKDDVEVHTWRHGGMKDDVVTWRYGGMKDEVEVHTWKHRGTKLEDNIEVHTWRHGDTKDEVVHTWRHGGMKDDVVTWRHEDTKDNVEVHTWRHGDIKDDISGGIKDDVEVHTWRHEGSKDDTKAHTWRHGGMKNDVEVHTWRHGGMKDDVEVHTWRHEGTKDDVEVHTWQHGGTKDNVEVPVPSQSSRTEKQIKHQYEDSNSKTTADETESYKNQEIPHVHRDDSTQSSSQTHDHEVEFGNSNFMKSWLEKFKDLSLKSFGQDFEFPRSYLDLLSIGNSFKPIWQSLEVPPANPSLWTLQHYASVIGSLSSTLLISSTLIKLGRGWLQKTAPSKHETTKRKELDERPSTQISESDSSSDKQNTPTSSNEPDSPESTPSPVIEKDSMRFESHAGREVKPADQIPTSINQQQLTDKASTSMDDSLSSSLSQIGTKPFSYPAQTSKKWTALPDASDINFKDPVLPQSDDPKNVEQPFGIDNEHMADVASRSNEKHETNKKSSSTATQTQEHIANESTSSTYNTTRALQGKSSSDVDYRTGENLLTQPGSSLDDSSFGQWVQIPDTEARESSTNDKSNKLSEKHSQNITASTDSNDQNDKLFKEYTQTDTKSMDSNDRPSQLNYTRYESSSTYSQDGPMIPSRSSSAAERLSRSAHHGTTVSYDSDVTESFEKRLADILSGGGSAYTSRVVSEDEKRQSVDKSELMTRNTDFGSIRQNDTQSRSEATHHSTDNQKESLALPRGADERSQSQYISQESSSNDITGDAAVASDSLNAILASRTTSDMDNSIYSRSTQRTEERSTAGSRSERGNVSPSWSPSRRRSPTSSWSSSRWSSSPASWSRKRWSSPTGRSATTTRLPHVPDNCAICIRNAQRAAAAAAAAGKEVSTSTATEATSSEIISASAVDESQQRDDIEVTTPSLESTVEEKEKKRVSFRRTLSQVLSGSRSKSSTSVNSGNSGNTNKSDRSGSKTQSRDES